MGVYTEAFYHFVWATRKREWFITDAVERDLHRFIHGKCDALRVHIYALSGVPDHVHLVVGLPATLSVSDFMEAVKGTSAHYINHVPKSTRSPLLAARYGLLTFAQHDLERIVIYVENQKQHHAVGGLLSPKMERAADWEAKSQPHEVGVPGVRAQ